MRFRDWKLWFKTSPIVLKWFIVVILFRPLIDGLWDVKVFSVSPLEILGVLVYFCIVFSLFINKRKLKYFSSLDIFISIFSYLLLINLIFILFFEPTMLTLGTVLKFYLPFFLYLYLRKISISSIDFIGILQTSLIASVIPFGIFVYELLTGGINPQYYKDIVILRGIYADMFYYSITLFLALIITFHFYLKNLKKRKNIYSKLLVLIISIGVIMLLKIDHKLSNIVFGILLLIIIKTSLRYSNILTKLLIITTVVFVLSEGLYVINQFYIATVQTELNIFSGEVDIRRAFHGRASRWERYFDNWSMLNPVYQIFGIGLSNINRAGIMVSGGMHSDYVRILFGTGVFGLSVYLIFLTKLFFYRVKNEYALNQFIVLITTLVILFSVTSMPINYQPLMYIFIVTIVYAQQQKHYAKSLVSR